MAAVVAGRLRSEALLQPCSAWPPTARMRSPRQEMRVFAVIRMFFDDCSCCCKPPAPCRANGIFRKNFGQCIRELVIESFNGGVGAHDPCSSLQPIEKNTNGHANRHPTGSTAAETARRLRHVGRRIAVPFLMMAWQRDPRCPMYIAGAAPSRATSCPTRVASAKGGDAAWTPSRQ
jgi:hypothetical protein